MLTKSRQKTPRCIHVAPISQEKWNSGEDVDGGSEKEH